MALFLHLPAGSSEAKLACEHVRPPELIWVGQHTHKNATLHFASINKSKKKKL